MNDLATTPANIQPDASGLGQIVDDLGDVATPGLTETCAGATINTVDAVRFGTIGQALPGCEVAVAPDGEILIRGPQVFRGYFKDVAATDRATIARDPRVRAEIQKEVDSVNAKLARIEQVKRFAILDRDLSQIEGELTPTLKVKRSFIYDKHADVFAGLYDRADES